MGSPKSPLDFSGRGGTAERMSFAACGETKDTELVTTKRADCFYSCRSQTMPLPPMPASSERAVRFYSRQSRSAKHSLGRALKPRKKKL